MVGPLVAFLLLSTGAAEAQVRTGSYTGTGIPRSIVGLGFLPDVVILKGNDNTMRAIARTSTMGLSKEMVSSIAASSGLITSLDPDGFSVSGDPRVNQATTTYHWIAFQAVPGELAVGTYFGNGSAGRLIAVPGAFQPAFVIVLPNTADPVYHRSSPVPGDQSFDFDNSTGDTNRIQALTATGFQVGDDQDVNGTGTSYHYVAWKAVPGKMSVGAYAGDGSDNRSITGVGFRPEYVIVKRDGSNGATHKPVSIGAVIDQSMLFNLGFHQTDAIQALEADGFQIGTQSRVNFAGDTFYWMAFADCGPLVTSEAPGSVTVTAPTSFEMTFNTAAGGSIETFYDLAEDPGRALDLAGALASSSSPRGLHNSGMAVGGVNYNAGVNTSGAKLDLLEATPTRVKLRQESFYQNGPTGPILAGVKGIGDYSIYPAGRLALRWNRQTTSAVTYTTEYHEGMMHLLGAGPLSGWTVYFDLAGAAAGTGGDDFFLAQNETAGAPGARTDLLDILYRDWDTANGHLATANLTDRNVNLPAERVNAFWVHTSAGTPIPAGSSETWNFLTYFKPTDFVNNADAAVSRRRNDYRTPSAITVGPGTQWQDAAENTAAAGDFFNEKEAAYVFDLDPGSGLSFDIDGSPTTRFAPFFKIRQWRALGPPPRVMLEGTPLFQEADYRADVKPVARAHFARDLRWYSTLHDTGAVTAPSVGSGGSVTGADFPVGLGRFGNGARFDFDGEHIAIPSAGNFDPAQGSIELWYRPFYDYGSGAGDDFGLFGYWIDAGNSFFAYHQPGMTAADGLAFQIDSGGVLSRTVLGAGASFPQLWRANEWVHLRFAWRAGPVATRRLDIYVNGVLAPPSPSSVLAYATPAAAEPAFHIGDRHRFDAFTNNANGIIDEFRIYGSPDPPKPLARGGLMASVNEFLADRTRNFEIDFQPTDAQFRGPYLYLGADAKFHGLSVAFAIPGSGVNPGDLKWEFWDGVQWTPLEFVAGFTDATSSFTESGHVRWVLDPPNWAPYSVDGGPDLFYVRVHLIGTGYSRFPTEQLIKTDILLFQYCGDVSVAGQTFSLGPPAMADLSVSKDDGQTSEVPGTSVTYTIIVTNNGPDAATGATVTDNLPATLTGASWSCAASLGSSCTPAGSGNILDTINLLVAGTATYTLTANIDPFTRASLMNTVTVSPPPGVTDPSGVNDFASDTDMLAASADVQVVKVGDAATVQLGALLTYTLTVTNNGPSGATNVMLSDSLPPGMTLDTAPGALTQSQGTCNYDVPTRTVDCSLGSIGPTLSATVTIKVRPGAAGTFTNTATTFRAEMDPAPGNNADGEITTVEVSNQGVLALTATSTNQRNVLEWVNPTLDYLSTVVVWRTDRFPTGPGDGMGTLFSGGVAGGRQKVPHDPIINTQTYYYGAFVNRSMPPAVSPGRFVTGRPFDHTPGPVKWAFATGATALAPPTVGGAGVIATSNDHMLYAMERGVDDDQIGVDSGEWPALFEPFDVGGPVQGRSPVVPVTVGGANPVVFVGSQDGNVYAIDATQGGVAPQLWVRPIPPVVQAAPAGIFSAFAGTLDYVLVGTRDSALSAPNAFVALDPDTGAEDERYNNGGAGAGAIGIINAMAAVDYGPPSPPRVYFTSYERTGIGSTNTLWCLNLNLSPPPVFSFRWARALGDIDSSPVLRNGRVYVGSSGTVYSIDAMTGGDDRTYVHGDGQVRGFVFPDRATNDLYFATDGFVRGISDTGAMMMPDKFAPISLGASVTPSAVLFVPGDHYVYAGGSDGKLYEIDVMPAVPVLNQVTLGNGLAVVGAPSLDRVYNLVHVGTEAGIFYAVQVPLP